MGDIVSFLEEAMLLRKNKVEVVDLVMLLRKNKEVVDLVLFCGLPFCLLGDFGSKTLLLLSKSGFEQLYLTLHL